MDHLSSPLERDKNLIFDIGAHTGKDCEFYLRKGFRVVAVEAFPGHAKTLRTKFASEIAESQFILEEFGVGERCENGQFFVHSEKDDWHRASPDPTRGHFDVIEIPFVTYGTIAQKYPVPYYLKIDIEDNDWCVISELDETNKPNYVSFEISKAWERCLAHLAEIGFSRFQIVNQAKHYQLRAPFPPLEGKFVDAQFDGHMTGLFGRELPEDGWRDYGTLLGEIPSIDWSDNQWYDFHAASL